MLSRDAFARIFVSVLAPRFRVDTENLLLMDSYYESFKEFSDETFKEIARMAFAKDFMPSPDWFFEQRVYLSEKARRENPPIALLPSAIDRELANLTEDDLAENRKKLALLKKEHGFGAIGNPRQNTDELLDENRQPIEPFRLWLEAQEIPKMLSGYSPRMAVNLQARSKSIQAEYLESSRSIEQEAEF